MAAPVKPVQHASQLHIDEATPMGAHIVEEGTTFRVWAPRAVEVYVITSDLQGSKEPGWMPRENDRLLRRDDGTWAGFVPGVKDGTAYRFYVVGTGSSGFKRDPFARELGTDPPFPDCDCLVRAAETYPWHDFAFRPSPFHELLIYQLHVGAFYGVDAQGQDKREKVATFLDVITRIPYLRDLGVRAVQLLPIQEFPYDNSLGYNNTDFFSPEMAYQVHDSGEIIRYLDTINLLLAERGMPALAPAQLMPGPNQLKALIDLLHINGISVIFDLVYNHAGGGFDDQSLYFLDRSATGDDNDSLYFTDQGWAGGLVFAYWNERVRDFLIQNAKFFLSEYHIDGARYDEVSVIDNHGGWYFCQELTSAFRTVRPSAIQIAEYWNASRELAVEEPPRGMGFDAVLADGLRDALRSAVSEASRGQHEFVNLDAIREALHTPYDFHDAWRWVNCLENHDIVYANRDPKEVKPRLPRLADPSNARSWYARSRVRFATSILLSAPGIPLLFMGQEILEDKNWSDNPEHFKNTLIWWDGIENDGAMRDFLRFMKAAILVRKQYAALCGPNINAFHVNSSARVIAFHRWLEGSGDDVIVVGSLSEINLYNYELGLPKPGIWHEAFNSDFFESSPGHQTAGNAGQVIAAGCPGHGFDTSARITIPANGVVILVR